MTQVKSAQQKSKHLARYTGADHRSLASRRAAFAAQMRDMALSDLKQVSERLKGLHAELERKDGRKWTHYELSAAMGIRPRTFQSWENGEVENRDGKGYDKMARWYSRKLGRKITRQWIVFGAAGGAGAQAPGDSASLSELSEAVGNLQDQVREILEEQIQLLAKLAEAEASAGDSQSSEEQPGKSPGSTGK